MSVWLQIFTLVSVVSLDTLRWDSIMMTTWCSQPHPRKAHWPQTALRVRAPILKCYGSSSGERASIITLCIQLLTCSSERRQVGVFRPTLDRLDVSVPITLWEFCRIVSVSFLLRDSAPYVILLLFHSCLVSVFLNCAVVIAQAAVIMGRALTDVTAFISRCHCRRLPSV
jgi:hypothetical protein